jgi:hypothetical protein
LPTGHELLTQSSDEVTPLRRMLKRFFPFYCALVAIVTFGYALYDPYIIDGDAVAYMDIGDLIRAHTWPGIVNGYWHPLYPALLALGHTLFHSNRFNELHAYYLVNYAIFLLQMVAIVLFTDSIVKLRDASAPVASVLSTSKGIQSFLLDQTVMRYVGLALLVIASQRELSLGRVRPDALLQALILFGLTALLTYLRTSLLRHAALMGLVFGFAYLTKSFAFVLTLGSILVLILFRWIYQRRPLFRSIAPAAIAFVCFALIAGPYVAALTKQKGRLNFGDSGALNYAWFVGGTEKMHLEPWQTDKFGSAEVHLKHPEKQLMASPGIYSYEAEPYGTYPAWFDTTFFNDTIKPHTAIKGEIKRGSRNVVLVFRYILNHPEPAVLLALFLLLGAGITFGWRPTTNAFWLVPLGMGAAMWVIYGTVNIEERYVTVGYLAIVLTLFAMLTGVSGRLSLNVRALATAILLFFAVLEPVESLRTVADLRRQVSVLHLKAGWDNPHVFDAAQALGNLGVKPGDPIACIGWRGCLYDHYWARVAGVRILTEVYVPDASADGFLETLPNREQAIATLRATGDKVLVGYFNEARMTGRTPATEGWQQLGESHLYAFPLNLPPGASTHPAPIGPNPSLSSEQ